MSVDVKCPKCGHDVVSAPEALAEVAIVEAHALHASCPLEITNLISRDRDDAINLQITCLHEGCQHNTQLTLQVPRWAVGAATIAFHAGHEGHKMRVEIDGLVIEPYTPPRVRRGRHR